MIYLLGTVFASSLLSGMGASFDSNTVKTEIPYLSALQLLFVCLAFWRIFYSKPNASGAKQALQVESNPLWMIDYVSASKPKGVAFSNHAPSLTAKVIHRQQWETKNSKKTKKKTNWTWKHVDQYVVLVLLLDENWIERLLPHGNGTGEVQHLSVCTQMITCGLILVDRIPDMWLLDEH